MIRKVIKNNNLDFLYLKILPISKYNFILNMVIYFIIPIMTLNYFLIFKDNKYKILIKEYSKSYNKKIFAWYFLLGFAFMFAILFLKVK